MKKFALSAFVVLTFVAYAVHERFGDSDTANIVVPVTLTDNSLSAPATPSPTSTPMMNSQQNMMGNSSSMGMGMMHKTFNDGEYTGQVADAFYGLVQVKTTIENDKITDVTFLKYPNDRRTSLYISQQAMPYLKQEAIQAQSAKVNIVSGATQTSRAFIESLQSALDQARI